MVRLDLSRLVMVVHDLGGPVGFELARRKPELIDGLFITHLALWIN